MRTTTNKKPALINLAKEVTGAAIRMELIEGLTSSKKYIHPKYFYDESGAWLFQQITRLDEYYLTRLEKSILKLHAPSIIREMPGNNIIELASGDCSKISILLNALAGAGKRKISYYAYEINPATIRDSASGIMKIFPHVDVQGVVADITSQFYAIPQIPGRLICFFGSTVGNMSPEQAGKFFSNLGGIMHPGEQLLVGMDMVKDRKILEKAYNDGQGITAAFNKNILFVVNSHLGTALDPDMFEHVAFFNEERSCIEMHLRARQKISISSYYLPEPVIIEEGETIHTEDSRKFTMEDIRAFSEAGGWETARIYTDADSWFSLVKFISH